MSATVCLPCSSHHLRKVLTRKPGKRIVESMNSEKFRLAFALKLFSVRSPHCRLGLLLTFLPIPPPFTPLRKVTETILSPSTPDSSGKRWLISQTERSQATRPETRSWVLKLSWLSKSRRHPIHVPTTNEKRRFVHCPRDAIALNKNTGLRRRLYVSPAAGYIPLLTISASPAIWLPQPRLRYVEIAAVRV